LVDHAQAVAIGVAQRERAFAPGLNLDWCIDLRAERRSPSLDGF
jgi:hypothetical protein